MDFREHSKEIWENYNSADWNSNLFSDKKSFVCALFSELAYEHLPQYELDQKSRVKIIPSESYWANYEKKQSYNILSTLRQMDFGENFIIESENLIIIGVRLKETLFITVRGTQFLNDVLTDISLMPIHTNYSFHSGFFKASLDELENLKIELCNYSNCNIYLTGHSLGGAIAAILNNLINTELDQFLKERNLIVKSCYTFGMPRVGNYTAVKNMLSPYQIYNPNDIVPLLPPKTLGYRNGLLEYRLSNNLLMCPNKGKSTINRIWSLITVGDIKGHFINAYCDLLRKLA